MKIKEVPEDFIVREVAAFSLTKKGKYAIFLLTKKSWNTEDAVQEVCKKLNMPRKKLGYSGTKDRQALTEQFISIPAKKKELAEKIKIKDIEIMFAGFSRKPIGLGDHLGNIFQITVKDTKAPKPKKEVINYFGRQRFSKNNAAVGKLIVKKDFKKAAETLGLEVENNDYLGAMKKIPLKTASLYVHAYQSLLWNKVAKKLAEAKVVNQEIPILGFATSFDNPNVEELYDEIMKEEKITKKDFIIRQWPQINTEGALRYLYVELKHLKITQLDDKKYKLEFFLPKGTYATTVLEQLFP